METSTQTYEIAEPLLQAVVNILNTLPAGQVRHVLNDLEHAVNQQQAENAKKAHAAMVESVRQSVLTDADQKAKVQGWPPVNP